MLVIQYGISSHSSLPWSDVRGRVRIPPCMPKSMELSKYIATVLLDRDWTQARMDICVGIASIAADDESKALINMRNRALMGDPSVRGLCAIGCGKGFAVCRLEPCRRRAGDMAMWAWECRRRRQL